MISECLVHTHAWAYRSSLVEPHPPGTLYYELNNLITCKLMLHVQVSKGFVINVMNYKKGIIDYIYIISCAINYAWLKLIYLA